MAAIRERVVDDVAARDKYSSLHSPLLSDRPEPEWRTVFGELEAILSSGLPNSVGSSRPLWSNMRIHIGHSLAQQAVRGRLPEATVEAETTMSEYQRVSLEPTVAPTRFQQFSIGEILPLHDSGSWPKGFRVSREQIYDDIGRLTGGSENMSGEDC